MADMGTGSAAITAEQLLAMPDDGRQRELVCGELRVMSPSGWEHSAMGARLARLLAAWVDPRGLGIVTGADGGYVLQRDPDTVVAPDVGFVATARLPVGSARQGFFEGAPDLAAEVLSPSDAWSAVTEKVEGYLAAGTGIVLVVDGVRRRVHVFRPGPTFTVLAESDTLEGRDIVPGWRLPLRELFEPRSTSSGERS